MQYMCTIKIVYAATLCFWSADKYNASLLSDKNYTVVSPKNFSQIVLEVAVFVIYI